MGAVGIDLLQTPFDLQYGCDKDEDGIPDQYERDSIWYVNNVPPHRWDVDNDGVHDWRDASENLQLGITAFKVSKMGTDPVNDRERFLFLAGYDLNGNYNPFDTIPGYPDDVRCLVSSGPFSLPVDSVITFIAAIVLGEFCNNSSPAERLFVINDRWAQWQYDMNWFLNVKETIHNEPAVSNVKVFPNPVTERAIISFLLNSTEEIKVKIYNVCGQLMQAFSAQPDYSGAYCINFDARGLPAGNYFLIIHSGTTSRIVKKIVVLH